MKTPVLTDFVELWVEDDGDIILCKRPEPDSGGPVDIIMFPSGNLCYGINEMEALFAELSTYGCEKKAMKKAILKVAFEDYNEPVTV